MTKDEALRLALDALECWQRNEDCNEPMSKIMGAIKATLEAKDEPVQVSPLQFVEMVVEKEHLVGKPIFWAEWPNKGQA
jgi:hypothetical protein